MSSSNILLAYNNRAVNATLTGGGWDSDYPLNNLKTRALKQVARTNVAAIANTQFRFDLAANYTLRALALVNHNLTTGALWRARTTAATLDMDFTGPTSMKPVTLTTSGGANGTRVGIYGTIEAATCPRYDFSPVNLASGTATQTISSVPAGTYLLITTGSNAAVMATGSTVSNNGTIGTTTYPSFVVVTATGDVTLTVLSAATAIHFRESLGLLVEEARTNSTLYGGDLSNAAHTKTRCTASATLLTATSTTNPYASQTGSVVNPTHWADVKAGTIGWCSLFCSDGANYARVWFNATTGAVGTTDGLLPVVVHSPAHRGGGVYRIAISVAATVTEWRVEMADADTSVAVSSIGDTLNVYRQQCEAGSFPTTYIPTTSAAVTRTADSVSITGSNFSGFYNQSEGTFYVEGGPSHPEEFATLFNAGDAAETLNERWQIRVSSGATHQNVVAAGGASQSIASGVAYTSPRSRVASALTVGSCATYANGDVVGTFTATAMPAPDKLFIGQLIAGEQALNGHIRRIAYWPTRRTNAELQSITTTGPDALGLDTGWQPAKQMTFHGDTPTNWGEQYPLIAAFDARTARYGTVEIDDTTNTATYVQLGQLFIAGGFQPTENAEQQGFADGRTDLSSSVKSVGGQKYGTARRRPRTVDFSFPMLTLEEGDHLDEMMAEVGTTEDVLYVPDPSDAAKSQRYGFLGTLRELSPLEYPLADKRAVPLRMEQKL